MSFINQGKSHFKLLRIRTDTDTKAGLRKEAARQGIESQTASNVDCVDVYPRNVKNEKRAKKNVKDLTDVNGVKDVM